MNVRPFELSDLDQVMAVYVASIHSLAAPFYTAEQLAAWAPPNPDPSHWRQRLAPLRTLIAEREGVVAGFCSHTLAGHLDLFFTHPAFARQGVATRLCQDVESVLRGAGVTRIFTEASLAARPFFDRCGFVVDREELVDCRGAQLRRYAMHKQLGPERLGARDTTGVRGEGG